jgi:hypothetical protein
MPSSGVVAFPPSMPSKPERSVSPVRSAVLMAARLVIFRGPERRPKFASAPSATVLTLFSKVLPWTVPVIHVRLPSAAGQQNHWRHKGQSLARTVRTMRTVAPRHLLAHW